MVRTDPEFRQLADAVAAACLARDGHQRGDRIRFRCPAHNDHNPSADFSIRTSSWCCRSCGASGGVLVGGKPLAKLLGIDSPEQAARVAAALPPPAPPRPDPSIERRREQMAGWYSDGIGIQELLADDAAMQLMDERMVSDVAIRNLGLGLTQYRSDGAMHRAISIPWVENCVTVALQYRFIDGGMPDRYRWAIGGRPRLFNSWAYEAPDDDRVIVVEGALKAAAVWSAGITSVVAIANKKAWTAEMWGLLTPFKDVVFALDPDARADAFSAAKTRPEGRAWVAIFPEKPDDYIIRCGGDPDCFMSIVDCARRAI